MRNSVDVRLSLETSVALEEFKAHVSYAVRDGKAPEHWLPQLEDAYIEAIAVCMLVRSPKIDAATRKSEYAPF